MNSSDPTTEDGESSDLEGFLSQIVLKYLDRIDGPYRGTVRLLKLELGCALMVNSTPTDIKILSNICKQNDEIILKEVIDYKGVSTWSSHKEKMFSLLQEEYIKAEERYNKGEASLAERNASASRLANLKETRERAITEMRRVAAKAVMALYTKELAHLKNGFKLLKVYLTPEEPVHPDLA